MRRKALGYTLGLLAALLMFELLSHGLFYVREGVPLWRFDATAQRQAENRLDEFDTRVGLPGLRLHPLFGWTTASNTPGNNNHGFFSDRDYPYVRQPNDFIVGVFGGSVAVNFWSHNARTSTFQNALREARPAIADREIVLLNFAKEAYRQPQQVSIFNYYAMLGQPFDLVINLNGYNEITSAWINHGRGIDIPMPSANLLFALAGLTRAQSVGSGTAATVTAKAIRAHAESQRIASFWLALTGLSALVEAVADPSETQAPDRDYDNQRNLVFIPRAKPGAPDREQFLDLFDKYWQNSSALMQSATDAVGVPYLHVLQPNQYVVTDRSFSAEERAIALNEAKSYDGLIDAAYRRILRSPPAQSREGQFADATRILDTIVDPVYLDDCCHMNTRGRDVLSKFVAREAARVLSEREQFRRE